MKDKSVRVAAYILGTVIVLGVLTILGIYIYDGIQEKYAPSETVMELTNYYNVPDGEAMIILDDSVYEKNAVMFDSVPYLDLESVEKMYSNMFFWSEEDNCLTYTAPTEVRIFTPDSNYYGVNDIEGKSVETDTPVLLKKNGELYISMEYLSQNNGLDYTLYGMPYRVMLRYEDTDYLFSDVVENTQIRVSNHIKSDVLKELNAGDRLMYIDGGGIQENGFVKVMSEDGVRGYVKSENISDSYYDIQDIKAFEPEEYTHLLSSDKIYLAWHMLYTKDSVDELNRLTAEAGCMNVVAPTWFYLTGVNGEMDDYANEKYMKAAHEKGIKVWGTFKNDNIEGKFSCTEDTHTVLSGIKRRNKLISSIMEMADKYKLDGINIDFESLKVDTGIYFIEFLRELSVECRNKGYILSVDNYVPENYNAFYNIAEQAKVVDYVVIMGYDQHTAGTGVAGSVAALDWFENAIRITLDKVAPEQVIMAVPFYTRLWKEKTTDGKTAVYVEEVMNMREAERHIREIGAEIVWKEKEGQNYAEYEKGDSTYKIWLEDEKSLAAKTDAIREADLAGMGAWKLGDEKKGTWQLIEEHMK